MESLDQDLQYNAGSGLEPTRLMRENWNTTAKWAQFLAIVGFVMLGLSLLMVGSLSKVLEMMTMMTPENPGLEIMMGMSGPITIFMVAMIAVQFALTFFQIRFAMQLKSAIKFTDQAAFEQAWQNFRNLFRYTGVLIIVMLVVYLVAAIALYSVFVR